RLPSFTPPLPHRLESYRALFNYRDSPERGGSYTEVWQKVARLDLADRVHIYRYLLDKKRRNCKVSSLEAALANLKIFYSFLKTVGKTSVVEVTRADLEAFIEHEQDRGMKLRTVRTYLAAVYTFLHFLSEEGIVSSELVQRKIRLRLPQVLPKAIEPDDVKQFLLVIDNIRDRALILLLLRTGMRIGELLATKLTDVNLKEGTIVVRQGTKNLQERVVYFSDDACEALKVWLKHRDSRKLHLFYSEWSYKMQYGSARWVFNKYILRAGLAHKGYTLHCLRHTFASEMLNAGMRLECLQQLLGHERIEVTRRYARLTSKTRKEEYFRAMGIIERGKIDGSYQLDRELETILKEKELLSSYDEELSLQP
ncbi:MAG: tyrosine-type recombinase/integrase, partial [Deltaproteobacteria bacterium]|nr:tyrosine-type recombinase/integrase [Deltaproteobacteria bacterium]